MPCRGLGIVLCLLGLLGACSKTEPRLLVIGSKTTAEQVFLAEVAAQHLEKRLGAPVARKFNWGETMSVHTALAGGEVDVYPEYGCTAMALILRVAISTDRNAVLERVRTEYKNRFLSLWLDPLGYDNRFMVGVLKTDAARLRLRKLSELARRTEGWRPAMSRETRVRRDGFALLDAHYPFILRAPPAALDTAMFARALSEASIDLIMAEAASIVWGRDDLLPLEDDAKVFPPCEASFVFRSEADFRFPGARRALEELSGKFTLEAVRKANSRMLEGHINVESAALSFLREAGLAR
jgi:glycine betaine/choline ABC-type transport system substrate-binding protein